MGVPQTSSSILARDFSQKTLQRFLGVPPRAACVVGLVQLVQWPQVLTTHSFRAWHVWRPLRQRIGCLRSSRIAWSRDRGRKPWEFMSQILGGWILMEILTDHFMMGLGLATFSWMLMKLKWWELDTPKSKDWDLILSTIAYLISLDMIDSPNNQTCGLKHYFINKMMEHVLGKMLMSSQIGKWSAHETVFGYQGKITLETIQLNHGSCCTNMAVKLVAKLLQGCSIYFQFESTYLCVFIYCPAVLSSTLVVPDGNRSPHHHKKYPWSCAN